VSGSTHKVPALVTLVQSRALIAGGVGLLACLIGGFLQPAVFFMSYLLAFLFWTGVGVGCLSLLFIQHLTGGRWGALIRRVLEAGTRTLRFMAIAFLPILLGLSQIYPWASSAKDAATLEIVHKKGWYLNGGFFLGRAVFYFLIWISVAYFASLWSRRLDTADDRRRLERNLRGLAGGGLVLLGLTITFSSIDWAMSIEAHWYSTIYGILFMVGQVLSAFTLAILLLAALADEDPFRSVVTRETVHDLGKLLFAFVMLWAYVQLSQFLIVWSANIPEEIPWYIRRTTGGWKYLAWLIIAAHFVLPFLALLSRGRKRDLRQLAIVAAVVFAARWLDLFWLVAPSSREQFSVHWLDLAAAVGLGGVWIALFARELAREPLLPQNEPELATGGHA
jgi:hypothetical protein